MTNEQVIKRINEIREILADYRALTSYDHEALDITISALSKQCASSVPETGSICTKTAENDEDRIAINLKKRTITERLIIAESLINSVIADSDQFRDHTKKTDEESINKQEVLTNMITLCDGCYLMEHCGQCNPNCLLRKAMDVVEKIKTDSERVSLSEQEKSNSFSKEPSEDGESEMSNSDEWWKNYIRSRMSNGDVPDIHVGKTDFKPGDKFILELGQERRMFGEFEIKGTDLYVKTDLLEKLRRFDLDYTGEWIFHQDWKDDEESPYECNWCGRTFDYDMNYCGYCGAYMKRKAK